MQTPHPDTYPVIQKKWKFSVALPDVFLDILRLKVGSLQWLGHNVFKTVCLSEELLVYGKTIRAVGHSFARLE
jgi:hypothetical protein